MKKVSVIIPIYNVEKYLPTCLDSVVNQTYKNLEIICVDDETPDNSVSIVKSYMANDERIKLVSQKNQGLSGARNTGVKNSTGDYIIFLDSDDWIDLETVEDAVSRAEKENAQAVLWGYTREFGDKSIEKKIFDSDKVFNENETKNLIHRRMAGLLDSELSNPENADSIVTAWGKLYCADIIKENNLEYIDTKIIGTEDALFSLYYFGFVNKCVFINKPYNHYRKDNVTSLTKKYKPKLFSQWSTLYDEMDSYITENNLPGNFKMALDNRICLSMIGLGLTELTNPDGIGAKVSNINRFLSNRRYVKAFSNLKLSYFPVHWKVFFFLCKNKMSFLVYLMLIVMNFMIGK